MITDATVFGRLVLAAVLGGAIGLERESIARPAGFRTHILVCIGSALLAMVSGHVVVALAGGTAADPGRIAAQVVSGIGFLGAGTILREGASVRGLTTAASLWAVAGVGLAVGTGFYAGAVATTGLVLLVLAVLTRIDRLLAHRQVELLRLLSEDRPGQIGAIGTVLGRHRLNISHITMAAAEEDRVEIALYVRARHQVDWNRVTAELVALPGVHSVGRGE